ncbi:MAG: hotdog domain-containing protein [Solirubrobacterales bacterium]
MSPVDSDLGPRIHIHRRIEWMDTDAAGIYHWTTVFRLSEAAEAELHTALGIAELTFGAMPRISVNFNFKRPLHFNDPVEIVLQIDQVGRSSIRYKIQVLGPDGVAANGRISACLIDRESGSPAVWPANVRRLLTSPAEFGDDVTPER